MRMLVAMMVLGVSFQSMAKKNESNENVRGISNTWEYEVKAGVNIGGIAPISFPREIREINSYSPKLNGTIEASVTHWLCKDKVWGISSGLRVEEKGMKTEARVKNYSTEILNEGSRVKGMWTGDVTTNYNSTLLTMPLMANYRFNDVWKVRAGMYVSYRLDGEFSGSVSNGYLREGSPIGERIEFADGKTSTFDFTSDLSRWHYGLQIGGTWRAFHQFTVNADFTWGLNNAFNRDFKTITFNMYPLYMNIGFGYRF